MAAFSWIYSTTTVDGLHLDTAARIGVIAITIAGTTVCPEFHALAWWGSSAVGLLLSRLLGAGGSSLVFGFGYGLLPGFLAALFGGRLAAERPIANWPGCRSGGVSACDPGHLSADRAIRLGRDRELGRRDRCWNLVRGVRCPASTAPSHRRGRAGVTRTVACHRKIVPWPPSADGALFWRAAV